MIRTTLFRAAAVVLAAAFVAACDSDSTTAPSATGIEAISATSTSGGAGTAAPVSPTVRVTSGGSPVQGAIVHFAVAQGAGGSVQYANVPTNAQGEASAGTWLLGSYPGTHTVTATVEGLAPVVFTAAVGPGLPAQLAITAGNNQSADPNTAVATNPSVTLRDAWNTPIANANVVFTVTGGGGTINGANSVTLTTNAQGQVTAGPWVVGSTPGPNTLRAQAGNVQVTLTATTFGPCDSQRPLIAVGATVNGSIVHGDPNNHCMVANIARDNFRVNVTAGEAILITLTSTDFAPQIFLTTTTGTPIGEVDGAGTASVRFFPGSSFTLLIGASALAAGQQGNYTLTVETVTTAVTACTPKNVIQPGWTNLPQAITNTDCLTDGTTAFYAPPFNGTPSYRSDVFWIYLTAGQSIIIRQAPTTDLDALFSVFSPTNVRTFRDAGYDGTAEQLTYTAAATGHHRIVFTSFDQAVGFSFGFDFGPYLMSITSP